MAYGRLDVFWPDGQFQTFALDAPTVSVGRSSGNAISLDTDNISRYHFKLTSEDGQVFITDLDSANGTFVDSIRLEAGKPQPLYGGEEIQIGELRLIYNGFDDSPTRPMLVPEETTQRIELEAPAFRINLAGPSQAVSPGAHITSELSITNTGAEPERYLIEVNGLPREWVRIDRPTVEVAPGKSEPVVISFKPSRRSESSPGDYHAFVTVRPHKDSLTLLNADFVLTLLPYGGFGMALESNDLSPDEPLRLHLHNQGSDPLPLQLMIRDPNGMLQAGIPAPQVTLKPGQRLMVQANVRPRQRRLFGETRIYPFDVVVKSGDAAGFTAAQRAYLSAPASLPVWAPIAIVGALSAVVMLLIATVAILSARNAITSVPQITRFEVSSTQVAQGEPLVINWQASNASRVVLTLNSTPVFREEGNLTTTSYTINTSSLSGNVVVSVQASSDGGVRDSSQTVFIVQPMQINLFTVNPPQLVRNVVQPITVSWSAAGASTTRILGLESFTTARIEPSYGSSATLTDIAGIPQNPLNLTLLADDGQGNTLEQTIVVGVIDPICVAGDAGVTLRAEPRDDAQVVSTLPESRSVVVDAQDETRLWLRVVLPGGVLGWGPVNAFECASNFRVENLRQVLVIPTVMPSMEASGTPATGEPVVTATPRRTTATPAATRPPTRSAPTPTAGGP